MTTPDFSLGESRQGFQSIGDNILVRREVVVRQRFPVGHQQISRSSLRKKEVQRLGCAAAVVAVITRISGVVFASSLMASDSAAPTSGPTAVRLPIAFGQGSVDVMSKNEVIGSP